MKQAEPRHPEDIWIFLAVTAGVTCLVYLVVWKIRYLIHHF